MRTRIPNAAVAVLLAVIAAFAPIGAWAGELKLAPIPETYLGSWGHHGSSFTITRYEFAPEGGSAIAQWRTYTPCIDTTGPTTKRNPPPCDSFLGNFIEPGGLASVALMHPEGQDDRKLTGLVHATTDQKGMFGKWGASVEFTMLPGNMLLVDTEGGSTMFCGQNTDFSLYPPAPCGA
jgi:hypothetical protein